MQPVKAQKLQGGRRPFNYGSGETLAPPTLSLMVHGVYQLATEAQLCTCPGLAALQSLLIHSVCRRALG